MTQLDRIGEIIATYRTHGWRLERALLSPQTRTEMDATRAEFLEGATVKDEVFDALWFTRPSHAGREAWELRLVSEMAFALFETFELDEAEQDREEARREMEARMREHAAA